MTDEREIMKQEIETARQGNKGNANRWYYVDFDVMERYGITRYELSKGTTTSRAVRIISPAFEGKKKECFAKQIYKHTKIGPDEHTFLCLKKMYNEPCPVCEVLDKLRRKNPEDERLEALYPQERRLMFVYDVRDEEHERTGLHWWDAPKEVWTNICILSSEERNNGEIIIVSDPDTGRDVVFEFKNGKKYEAFGFIDKGPVPKEWLEGVPNDFDEVLKKSTYEEIAKEIPSDIFGEEVHKNTEKPIDTKATETGRSRADVPNVSNETKAAATRTQTRGAVTRGNAGTDAEVTRAARVRSRLDELSGKKNTE